MARQAETSIGVTFNTLKIVKNIMLKRHCNTLDDTIMMMANHWNTGKKPKNEAD